MKMYLSLILFTVSIYSQNISKFNEYFLDKTLRIDYFHIGSNKLELFTIDKLYKYDKWAGSTKNIIDNLNNGKYCYKIYDLKTNNLIFSKGFDTFFQEYASTSEGLNGVNKTFHETALIPFPKQKIFFVIEKRNTQNILEEIFRVEIDPESIFIIDEKVNDNSVHIFKPHLSGDPHDKVDIVILAEGYTISEKNKFQDDLEKFVRYFFEQEPFKSLKEKFNIYGIFKPSQESGTDLPGAKIFANTALNTSIWTFGSERYLMSEDNKTIRDLAAYVPYDAICLQVNHSRYGGGGIYNQYCTYTTDNQFSKYLFIHEFGHSFSGLADEYYTSDVAYNDLYKPTVEPIEPNITALLDKDNLKWKNFLSEGIEIPTPWEKAEFDSMGYNWMKERNKMNNYIAELKKNKAPIEKIREAENEYAIKDKLQSENVDKFLKNSKYWGKVGAFEGAGYRSSGLYRPMLDCIMFSKGEKPFCRVCEDAIKKVIKYYSE